MRRREFIIGIGLSNAGLSSTGLSSIWPPAARAQDAGRTYRIGMMFPFPRDRPLDGQAKPVRRVPGSLAWR
jgi:hypothetical protein